MEPSSNEKHDTTYSILKEVAHLPKLDLGLPSYDSLFSTEEERQEANSEKVMAIPIDKITDFKEHPFHVTMDEDMANDICKHGDKDTGFCIVGNLRTSSYEKDGKKQYSTNVVVESFELLND